MNLYTIKFQYMFLLQKVLRICIAITFFLSLSSAISAQKESPEMHKHRWNTPASADELKNPFANNPAAAADSGKITYMKICSICHGTSGKGNGIASGGLAVKPADHTSDHVQLQSDGSLFYELTNGHVPMPAYKTLLSEKQRWQLVCFIRTLKSQSPVKKN